MSDMLTLQPQSIRPLDQSGSARAPAAPGGVAFSNVLRDAVAGVEKLQLEADAAAHQQALGAGNLHETAIALEKADISLRVMVRARNKIVDAYQEVMRMNV
jgi:flagellar hook-basal body complex protein FliE